MRNDQKPQQPSDEDFMRSLCQEYQRLIYVPEGYEVVDGRVSRGGNSSITYMDQNGNEICVYVYPFANIDVYHFDTEDADIQSVSVQGNDAQLITKQIENTGDNKSYTARSVIWTDSEQHLLFNLYTSSLTEDDILQVAEGISWSESNN